MFISKKVLAEHIMDLNDEIHGLKLELEVRDRKIAKLTTFMNNFQRCEICGKFDHIANMAYFDVTSARKLDVFYVSTFMFNADYYVHPECAKIVRSEDGEGWCKAETHNKTVKKGK